MPYKDYEKQKEYQRRRWRLKKQNLPTRLTQLLSQEEKERRHKESQSKRNKKYRTKKQNLISKYIGDKCFFCKYDKRIQSHRKDLSAHKDLFSMSFDNLEREMRSQKYVRLCFHCHKSVHWCSEMLNLSWENIASKFK